MAGLRTELKADERMEEPVGGMSSKGIGCRQSMVAGKAMQALESEQIPED